MMIRVLLNQIKTIINLLNLIIDMISNQCVNLTNTNNQIKIDLFLKYKCFYFANYAALNKAT